MFSYLPSLLGGGWAQLPAYAALSGALQRRLLAYLLRRALGRFLAPGALDAASIDAAIGSGSVDIAGLALSAEAINELLPPGPLRVVSGQLGRVSVKLPFPNLWSGELSLALADIDLCVALDGRASPPGSPFDSPRASRSTGGLEESILGAAESVFHDSLEGQELEASLQASMLDARSAAASGTAAAASPSNADADVPAPSSLISGIVEGLLARLKVSVRRISLQLQHSRQASAGAGVKLELRIDSFDLLTEASAPATAHPAGLQDRLVQEVVRTARIGDVSLWMTLPAELRAGDARARPVPWRATSSSESESSDSDSEQNAYMEMSSAIPDLRQSSIIGDAQSALGASQASVYASAEDIRGLDVSEATPNPPYASISAAQPEHEPEMLLSLGTDPVVVRFTTLKEVARPAADIPASQDQGDDAAEAQEHDQVVALPVSRLRTSLGVELGAVTAFVHPRQLAALMSIAGELGSASGPRHDAVDVAPTSPARTSLDASLRIAALHLICAYEPPEQLSPPARRAMQESLQVFWQRPGRMHPAIGHLRLRVEGVELDYAVAASSDGSATARALVADIGVYEHLSPRLANGDVASIFPILLADANMLDQYEVPLAGTPSGLDVNKPALAPLEQCTMDAADWRLAGGEQRAGPSATSEASRASSQGPYWRAAWGERAWKVRPRARRASSTASSAAKEPVRPAVRIEVVLRSTGPSTTIELAPLHAFVDVSTVNRLMPLAQSAGAALRQNAWSSARSDLSQSFATLTASPQMRTAPLHEAAALTSSSTTELRCALLRVELRVPSAAAGPQAADLRSGILVVDVRGIDARLGSPSADTLPHRASVGFATGRSHTKQHLTAVQEDGRCSVAAVVAFFKPIRETRATAFAVVGKLDADESDFAPRDEPQPLSVRLLRRQGTASAKARSSVDVKLPAVRTSLSKVLLDQLELLADDLSQWSASLGREADADEADGGADALKILGSRFFGTKHSISALSGSSDSTELARKGDSAPALALSISEVSVSLLIPRMHSAGGLHHLAASASEIAVFVDPAHAELTTLIDLSIMDVVVKEFADETATTFLSRTLEQSLSSGGIAMISLHLLSIAEPDTSYRESRIDVALRGFTVAVSPADAALLSDLLRFLQSPEGAFEHVEPNEVTRLSLRVRDVSLVVSAPRTSAKAAAVIGELSLKAKLSPYSRRTTYKFALRDVAVLLAERTSEPSEDSRRKIRTPLDHWGARGFVSLVELADAKGSLTLSTLTRPEVDVKVTLLRIEVTACADTLGVAAELSGALTPVAETPVAASDSSSSQSLADSNVSTSGFRPDEAGGRDMLASLDENAFRRSGQNAVLTSSADLVEDDIPRNASYLGAAPASPSILSAALEDDDLLGSGSIETLHIAPSVAQSANVVLQNDVVTVRLLDPRGIRPKPNYFTDPLLEPQTAQNSAFASSVRVRVADCDFALRLFAGYDWGVTRQAIENEARRVRRRLQKIQQLLDEGQTPDDSVEAITGALFDSIHISLPAAQSELDVGAAMKAMDDELGDQSETASNASTWQPLPSGPGVRPPVHGPASRRKSKLHRSRKSMIDIELKGIEAEFDGFGRTSPTASRLAVNARSLQILDNIPTSTWRTFLTEMLPENRAFRRNEESRMLRIEVRNVRPQQGQLREEVRVRAKLAPLRLHVDQDALDFFKKFFSFKTPGVEPEPAAAPAPPSGPFIQHAEIYPVRLKLDYKPKRVDYGLLREGKTVELMNFFHFDEAEMTLRHVTMRGITGWPRLFDTLNDIWTPDVKANQLADVLSGIAPVRSLVNVGAGLADLVLLPIEQYQRDGRLARGLQKGASSFAKTTALEAVRLGAKLATGTQVILEQAEHVLGGRMNATISTETVAPQTSGASTDAGAALDDEELDNLVSRYAEQPEDMRDALTQAYSGLSRGLSSAARTILAVPMEVHERSSGGGGTRPVIRAVPIAVLRGAAGASEAVSKTLQGLQRELDGGPQQSEDKYKARKPAPRRAN